MVYATHMYNSRLKITNLFLPMFVHTVIIYDFKVTVKKSNIEGAGLGGKCIYIYNRGVLRRNYL